MRGFGLRSEAVIPRQAGPFAIENVVDRPYTVLPRFDMEGTD